MNVEENMSKGVIAYGLVWLTCLVLGVIYAPSGMGARAIIVVNLLFITINLIGAGINLSRIGRRIR